MLKNDVPDVNLFSEKSSLKYLIPKEVQEFYNPIEENVFELHYPVLEYPTKVTSLNLDKTPNFSGRLTGIKGQYLIFEDGTVFNVRTFEGYVVNIII